MSLRFCYYYKAVANFSINQYLIKTFCATAFLLIYNNQSFIKMADKRKNQWCYNCKHFNVTESKNRTKYVCEVFNHNLVGANWCKCYKPIKPEKK